MTENQNPQTDNSAALRELNLRRALVQVAKKIVDAEAGDPRRPEALRRLNDQLAQIDQRITDITGTPPPVVVELKTAVVTGRAPGLGE